MNATSAGGIALGVAVVLGAFGAHALTDILVGPRADWYKTASDYHFWHAIGLLVLGLSADRASSQKWHKWSVRFMTIGLLFFSGCLYAMALTGVRVLGAIVPIGGLCFILAWLCLVMAFRKTPSAQ